MQETSGSIRDFIEAEARKLAHEMAMKIVRDALSSPIVADATAATGTKRIAKPQPVTVDKPKAAKAERKARTEIGESEVGAVLDGITHEPISFVDLVTRCGMPRATVAYALRKLVKNEIVVQEGQKRGAKYRLR